MARPSLYQRLAGASRVSLVSAPAGSGKTVLLRSWIAETGLHDDAAYLCIGPGERDSQGFWLSVVEALRGTTPGATLVQGLSAAPELDGWTIVERLLSDLAPLRQNLVLVIDDLQELGSADAVRQLELLLLRANRRMRFVLAGRQEPQLGLHRLRLEGELDEIRAAELQFTLAEAHALFTAAGVSLSDDGVALLHRRTEGWVAGLRLAALSLAGHPDPERFAIEFSGSERTVAEYLVAEVLDRQSEEVRNLLLRTSILDRVNGPLADLLTGSAGGERILQDLEQQNAFVASVDTARSWFRYHQMFAGLLALELRRTAPDQVAVLHQIAAGWLVRHGYTLEAIRHAQAAEDWNLAIRMLADAGAALHLDGHTAAIPALLAEFPSGLHETNAELAAIAAADELVHGSLELAQRYVDLAEAGSASVPSYRHEQLRLLIGYVRLQAARQRADVNATLIEANRLQAMADAPQSRGPGTGEDLRALALVNLGIAQTTTFQFDEAITHLERGIDLAHRIGRPYLEFSGLAWQAGMAFFTSCADALKYARQATAITEEHGWTDEPMGAFAHAMLGSVLFFLGRLDEAESVLQIAQRGIRDGIEPACELTVHHVRAALDLLRGREVEALAELPTFFVNG